MIFKKTCLVLLLLLSTASLRAQMSYKVYDEGIRQINGIEALINNHVLNNGGANDTLMTSYDAFGINYYNKLAYLSVLHQNKISRLYVAENIDLTKVTSIAALPQNNDLFVVAIKSTGEIFKTKIIEDGIVKDEIKSNRLEFYCTGNVALLFDYLVYLTQLLKIDSGLYKGKTTDDAWLKTKFIYDGKNKIKRFIIPVNKNTVTK